MLFCNNVCNFFAGRVFMEEGSLANESLKDARNGFGLASLICGSLALVFFLMLINIPFVVAAVVLGIVQIVSYQKKWMAVFGILAAMLSILLMLIGWVVIFHSVSNMDPTFIEQFRQQMMLQT